MPIVRPSGAGDEVLGNAEVRDGGTILKGGSNAAGIFTKSLSLAEVADDQGQGLQYLARRLGPHRRRLPVHPRRGRNLRCDGG